MKKETKALVEWIKAQIRIAAKLDDSYLITTDAISTHKSLEEDALKFLDSLPEIESHLCRGGYIQDNTGTPCGHGDKISFLYSTLIFTGTLTWIPNMGKFLIKPDSDFFKYHKKADEYLTFYDIQAELNGFSKVNEVVE